MPDDTTPIPSVTQAEAQARRALDWAARRSGVARVLLALADAPLTWAGDSLTAPAGPLGRIQVALDHQASPGPGVFVLAHLPPWELHSSTIHVPAHVLRGEAA